MTCQRGPFSPSLNAEATPQIALWFPASFVLKKLCPGSGCPREPGTQWSGGSSCQDPNCPQREPWHLITQASELMNHGALGAAGPGSAASERTSRAEGKPT